MENVNKFKVFTIVIICTFVFVIGAIYTNTKDVTEEKTGERIEQTDAYTDTRSNYGRNTNAYGTEIDDLRQRVDELSAKIDNSDRRRQEASSSDLKCRIAGTLSGRGMEEMSPSAAVNDAKINNNDLVVLCSF